MKTVIHGLFFCLITFYFSNLNGQSNDEIIDFVYDFANSKFEDEHTKSMNTDKDGKYFRVKIENINLGDYSITIAINDTIVDNSFTFEKLISSINISGVSDILSKISPVGNILSPMRITNEDVFSGGTFPGSTTVENGALNTLLTIDSLTIVEINELFHKDQIYQSEVMSTLMDLENEIFETLQDIRLNLMFKRRDIDYDTSSIVSPSEIREELKSLRSNIKNERINLIDEKVKFITDFKNLRSKIRFVELKETFNSIYEENLENYRNLDSAFFKLSKDIRDTSVVDLIREAITLSKLKNKPWISPIYKIDKDVYEVTVSFKPRSVNIAEKNNLILKFKKGGNKSHSRFSAGFFADFIKDQSYSIMTTADSSFTIVEEDSGNMAFGIYSQFNLSISDVLHFGIGPGITYREKFRPKLLISAGILVNDDKGIFLNLGASLGYRDKLSNTLDLESEYKIKPTDITVSQTQVNLFLGLAFPIQ